MIYPTLEQNADFNISDKKEIPEYKGIYKLSISVPLVNSSS